MSVQVVFGGLWFSQKVNEYHVKQHFLRKKFETSSHKIKVDWDNCSISIAGVNSDGKLKFFIRSKTNRNSDYMGNIPVQLRFMLEVTIDPTSISEPTIEYQYSVSASQRRNLPQSVKQLVHDRWVLRIGDEEVWEWTQMGKEIRSSTVYALHQEIRKFLDTPHSATSLIKNTLRVPLDEMDEVIPVVYQPAIDSLGNFLRELHCAKRTNPDDSIDVEVTMLFNNEQLRRFKLLDLIYRWIRKFLYGRVLDIESFKIHFMKEHYSENYFTFEGIYSGDYNLIYDTIHLDAAPNVPRRAIKYYFADYFHSVVFVNTSNHAMAEHDNNNDLWKWEYIPWLKNAPVVLGTKSRKEIEKQFKPLLYRIFGT